MPFLSSADFFEKFFQSVKQFVSRYFVGHNLGLNCVQKLTTLECQGFV